MCGTDTKSHNESDNFLLNEIQRLLLRFRIFKKILLNQHREIISERKVKKSLRCITPILSLSGHFAFDSVRREQQLFLLQKSSLLEIDERAE